MTGVGRLVFWTTISTLMVTEREAQQLMDKRKVYLRFKAELCQETLAIWQERITASQKSAAKEITHVFHTF